MEGGEDHKTPPLVTTEEVSGYQAAIVLTSPTATGSLCVSTVVVYNSSSRWKLKDKSLFRV